jgi:hypothetical protein
MTARMRSPSGFAVGLFYSNGPMLLFSSLTDKT